MPLGVWTLRKHSVIEKTRHNSRPEDSFQTSGGPGTPEDGWRAKNRPPTDHLALRHVARAHRPGEQKREQRAAGTRINHSLEGAAMPLATGYLDRYKSTTAAGRPPPPPTPSTNATQPPQTPQYGDRRVARAADAARIRAHNRIMRRRLAATKPQIIHRHSEIVVVARREARARQIDARERRRADLQRSERASRRQRRSASPVRAARRLRPGTAAARVALAARREEDRAARRIELRRRNAEQARLRGASSRCDTRLSTPVEQRRRHLRRPPDPDLVAELARVLAGQL